jgi:hypothetical protein
LLEKAKMRGRKGKKNSKPAAAKNGAALQARTTPHDDGSAPPPIPPLHDPGPEDEEYYEEEEAYDDREQEHRTDYGTQTAVKEGYGHDDGTERPRPLRPPSGSPPQLDRHAPTITS